MDALSIPVIAGDPYNRTAVDYGNPKNESIECSRRNDSAWDGKRKIFLHIYEDTLTSAVLFITTLLSYYFVPLSFSCIIFIARIAHNSNE